MTLYQFEHQEREAENRVAKYYNQSYHDSPVTTYWDDDFAEFVHEHYSPGDRILDLGCGPASLWRYWSDLPDIGVLVGLDLSDGMIGEARTTYERGKFVVGRTHSLPFPAGSFDIVIASSVLHHIPDDKLDEALAEIVRVLDEHGIVIGREPIGPGQFGTQPGWFSGALMNFRHFVYRVTHSREHPEEPLDDYHHAYDPPDFLSHVAKVLEVNEARNRFPFSKFVSRVHSKVVAEVAKVLDRKAADRRGAMFYYKASRNYAEAADVKTCIDAALTEMGCDGDDKEFLAYLQAATQEIQRQLSGNGKPDGRT